MRRSILIVAATAFLVVACDNEGPLTVETASPEDIAAVTDDAATLEPQPITEPVDIVISDTSRPSLLQSAELKMAGREGGAAGDIESAAPGDALEIVVRVTEVPEALAAWVHWLGPDGEKISEEQKPVPDEGVVSFRADTDGWSEGDYSAEIFVGGNLVDVKQFRLITE